jgi:hypothetical protein
MARKGGRPVLEVHRAPLRTSILAPNFETLMQHAGEGHPWPHPWALLDDALTLFWEIVDNAPKEAGVRRYAQQQRFAHVGSLPKVYPKRRSNTVVLKGTVSAANDARLRASTGPGKAWPSVGELLDDALEVFWGLVKRQEELRLGFVAGVSASIRQLPPVKA